MKLNYVILLLLCFLGRSGVAALPDTIKAFRPDTNLIKLAQEYDRKYFPLFLEALEAVETLDTSLFQEYFQRYDNHADTSLTRVDLFEAPDSAIRAVYFCPADNQKYEISFPVEWTNPRYPDPSWNLWFYTLNWLELYINAEDPDSIFLAFYIIDNYLMSHTKYPDPDSRFTFGDHASAVRLELLIKAYKKYSEMGIEAKDFENRLINAILYHLFYLVSLEHYAPYTNHAIMVNSALIESLKSLNEFKLRDQFLIFAFSRIFEEYRYGFTSEGVHKEHSPCYHFSFSNYVNSTIKSAVELSINVPEDMLILQKKANYYRNFLDNRDYALPIGDCYRIKGGQRSALPFQNGCKIFPKSGWAFLKDSATRTSIVLQSDFNSFSHYQKDETSFILNVDGNDLIIDPGLFSYDKTSPFYYYMQSAFAHNVLIVEENEFITEKKNTGLSGITRYYCPDNMAESVTGIIEMTHPHYLKSGIELYRQFAFIDGRVIIITDSVISDSCHALSQVFHLETGAKVNYKKNRYVISWESHPYEIIMLSNEQNYEVIEGQLSPVQGWYFPGHNQAAKSPVLILQKNDHTNTFHTILEIRCNNCKKKKNLRINDQYKELLDNLTNLQRRTLISEPSPNKWKINR